MEDTITSLGRDDALRLISEERLRPYWRSSNTTIAAGIELYEWNAQVSAALWTTLGHVEVVIRNVLHLELTAWSEETYSDPRWFVAGASVLTEQAQADLEDAYDRLTRKKQPQSAGRVVAELNFSFWRYLLASQYDRTLWRTCLHKAFVVRTRPQIYRAMDHLHDVRNRIAHHETIYNRDISGYRDDALTVARCISPAAEVWIESQCHVLEVLDTRPPNVTKAQM